jgi:NADPH:quinone reductase-like Zn-dependent oxidoreductase
VNVGDEVFCCLPFKDGGLLSSSEATSLNRKWTNMKSGRFCTGSVSEFALVSETFVVSKPQNLSFVEAASLPLVALTAIQMFEKVPGGVSGKTVFIPAACKYLPHPA